jgi:transcription antitermination protein NusB
MLDSDPSLKFIRNLSLSPFLPFIQVSLFMARGETRRVARLAAVQALYHMEHSGASLEDVSLEFEANWLGQSIEHVPERPVDKAFFQHLLKETVTQQRRIDPEIHALLAEGWVLARLDAVLRAILRVGVCELLTRRDVPVQVTISEYVDLTNSFYATDVPSEEAKVANGLLDALARRLRSEDFDLPKKPAKKPDAETDTHPPIVA